MFSLILIVLSEEAEREAERTQAKLALEKKQAEDKRAKELQQIQRNYQRERHSTTSADQEMMLVVEFTPTGVIRQEVGIPGPLTKADIAEIRAVNARTEIKCAKHLLQLATDALRIATEKTGRGKALAVSRAKKEWNDAQSALLNAYLQKDQAVEELVVSRRR